MDEMREKVEGMQAQIEDAEQMIRDLQGTICLLEDQKAKLEEKIKVMELDIVRKIKSAKRRF